MANPNGNGRSDPERQKFERELLELMPFLKSFARSLSGSFEVGDDLAQEALAKAWEARTTYAPDTNMKAWLFTILRNQFYSDRRRAWRQEPWNEEVAAKIPDTQASAAENAYDLQRTLWVMALLSDEQRDSLVAVGYLGLSYEDAALTLNCAVGTVKSRVARARTALTNLLESERLEGHIDLTHLKTMVNSMSPDDPFYPIAAGYRDLYAGVDDNARKISHEYNGSISSSGDSLPSEALPPSEVDQLWNQLLESGALNGEESLEDLMRG